MLNTTILYSGILFYFYKHLIQIENCLYKIKSIIITNSYNIDDNIVLVYSLYTFKNYIKKVIIILKKL